MPRSWIIFIILLAADVLVAWMISESPMPLLLVSAGLVFFGALSLVDRISGIRFSKRMAPILAIAFFVAEWWLFRQGLARVMLSELPLAFHLGLSLHFWLWMRETDERVADEKNNTLWIAMTAGALVFWTAGTTEIYGNSKLLVRSIAALGLILPVWQIFQSASKGRKAQPAAIFSAFGATILLAALVGPMDRVSSQLFTWFNRNTDDSYLDNSGFDPELSTVGNGTIDDSSRQLPNRADLQFNEEVRAHLLVENRTDFGQLKQQPIYLRTSSLAIFETPSRLAPARQARWVLDSDDGEIDGRTFIKEPQAGQPILNYSVLIDRGLISTLPLVSGTDRVNLESIYEFAFDWWQIEPRDQQQLIRFKAATPLASLDTVELSNPRLQPGTLDKFPFRAVPFSGLSLNVGDLAKSITARETTLTGKLKAIEAFFARETRYSLAYRNPKNLDPMENFLFHEKRGHCELYASATVLMLRHLNIPSRVSYGYLGGDYDLENRLITFRDRDGHAWPEVFVEGKGWQIFDTTPESSGRIQPPQPGDNRAAADVNLSAYKDIGGVEQVFASNRSAFARILDAALLFLSRNFMTLLGCCALTGAVWSFYSRKRRGRSASGSQRNREQNDSKNSADLPGFVQDFLKIGSSNGIEKQSSQTWLEFLDQLKLAGLCHTEFDDMVSYLYAIRYCNAERDRNSERDFSKTVRAFSDSTGSCR